MKKGWSKERKWEMSKTERTFEGICERNGFEIIGYKEYQSKTILLIKKDEIELEYTIDHVSGKDLGIKHFEFFKNMFDIKATLEILSKEYKKTVDKNI